MTTLQCPSRPAVDLPALPAPRTAPPRRHRRLAAFAIPAVVVIVGTALVALALTGFGTTIGTQTTAVAETGAAVAQATSQVALTDVSDIAAAVTDSVVLVEVTAVYRGRMVVSGSGSGVILDIDGTIVTNAHVVDGATSVEVVLADGASYDATVLTADTSSDLALIRIPVAGLTPIELGSTTGLLVGDPVIAVGNPLGLDGGPSVSTGIVSALGRTLTDNGVILTGIIQTDAAITEGSSGGALLDGAGRLVGITTAVGVSSVGIEGMGFAIPVEAITALLATISGV